MVKGKKKGFGPQNTNTQGSVESYGAFETAIINHINSLNTANAEKEAIHISTDKIRALYEAGKYFSKKHYEIFGNLDKELKEIILKKTLLPSKIILGIISNDFNLAKINFSLWDNNPNTLYSAIFSHVAGVKNTKVSLLERVLIEKGYGRQNLNELLSIINEQSDGDLEVIFINIKDATKEQTTSIINSYAKDAVTQAEPSEKNQPQENIEKEFGIEQFGKNLKRITISTQYPVTVTLDIGAEGKNFKVSIFTNEKPENPTVVNLGTKNIEEAEIRRERLVKYLEETLHLTVDETLTEEVLIDEVSSSETPIPKAQLKNIQLIPSNARVLLAKLKFEDGKTITVNTGYYSNLTDETRGYIIKALEESITNSKTVADINTKLAEAFWSEPKKLISDSRDVEGKKISLITTGFPETTILVIEKRFINLCTVNNTVINKRVQEVVSKYNENEEIENYYLDVSVKLEGNTLTLMRAEGTEELVVPPKYIENYYNKLSLIIPENLNKQEINTFVKSVNEKLEAAIKQAYTDDKVKEGESKKVPHLKDKPTQTFKAFDKAVTQALKEGDLQISIDTKYREYPSSRITIKQQITKIR